MACHILCPAHKEAPERSSLKRLNRKRNFYRTQSLNTEVTNWSWCPKKIKKKQTIKPVQAHTGESIKTLVWRAAFLWSQILENFRALYIPKNSTFQCNNNIIATPLLINRRWTVWTRHCWLPFCSTRNSLQVRKLRPWGSLELGCVGTSGVHLLRLFDMDRVGTASPHPSNTLLSVTNPQVLTY